MGSFSNFLENEVLDHVFGGAAYSAPATLYIAACTAEVTDASTGSDITEADFGSYARVAVTNNATNFPAASSGAKSNGTTITFPTATSGSSTVTYIAICDASSNGNVLAWAALAASKAVASGDTLEIAAGDLDLSLD